MVTGLFIGHAGEEEAAKNRNPYAPVTRNCVLGLCYLGHCEGETEGGEAETATLSGGGNCSGNWDKGQERRETGQPPQGPEFVTQWVCEVRGGRALAKECDRPQRRSDTQGERGGGRNEATTMAVVASAPTSEEDWQDQEPALSLSPSQALVKIKVGGREMDFLVDSVLPGQLSQRVFSH